MGISSLEIPADFRGDDCRRHSDTGCLTSESFSLFLAVLDQDVFEHEPDCSDLKYATVNISK
jgi:hypothetical protein